VSEPKSFVGPPPPATPTADAADAELDKAVLDDMAEMLGLVPETSSPLNLPSLIHLLTVIAKHSGGRLDPKFKDAMEAARFLQANDMNEQLNDGWKSKSFAAIRCHGEWLTLSC
jgi:hypothetical protein